MNYLCDGMGQGARSGADFVMVRIVHENVCVCVWLISQRPTYQAYSHTSAHTKNTSSNNLHIPSRELSSVSCRCPRYIHAKAPHELPLRGALFAKCKLVLCWADRIVFERRQNRFYGTNFNPPYPKPQASSTRHHIEGCQPAVIVVYPCRHIICPC